PRGEETAASERYGIVSSEAQAEVHGGLTTRRATPCQQAFQEARGQPAAHSDARLAHVCHRAGYWARSANTTTAPLQRSVRRSRPSDGRTDAARSRVAIQSPAPRAWPQAASVDTLASGGSRTKRAPQRYEMRPSRARIAGGVPGKRPPTQAQRLR